MRKRRQSLEAPEELSSDLEPEIIAAPRARLSWLWVTGKILVGVCLVLGAAGAVAYGARQFAVTSSRFAIHNFEAEGSRRFSADQLAALAKVSRGDNLFALDDEKAQRKLAESPWIEWATISRKLPDTLKFEVKEYTAAASALIGNSLYLVTRDGHPIIELGSSHSGDLPVVTGITPQQLSADRPRALARVARGVELVRRYERMPLAKVYAAQEVHLASDGAVALVVGTSGITLQMGKAPFRQKLLMAARILSKVRARGQLPSVVFLDNEAHLERVVVRLR